MARPRKKGLDYFPLDADIFEDDKLFDLQNEYGPLGEVIYLRLLCLVYKHGYYYRFESVDKLAAMVIKSVGNRWIRDKKSVVEVIAYLAEINLFSAELMRHNILSSKGIQERYLAAVERRQTKIEEYNLLKPRSESGIFAAETDEKAAETPKNRDKNATKESIENEKKSEETKADENRQAYGEYGRVQLTEAEYSAISADYGKENADKYIKKMDNWLKSKGAKPYADFEAALRGWLERDGVKKAADDEISKYYQVVNIFD